MFQLAADMGGMGFIGNNRALSMPSVLTNTHMLMAAKELGVKRLFYFRLRLCVQRRQADQLRRRRVEGGGRLSGSRKMATAGKTSSASACAGTATKILAYSVALHDFTMSIVRIEPGMAAVKKLRRPSVENSSRPREPEITKSRFGATAIRPAASCISMIAPKEFRPSL